MLREMNKDDLVMWIVAEFRNLFVESCNKDYMECFFQNKFMLPIICLNNGVQVST